MPSGKDWLKQLYQSLLKEARELIVFSSQA